MRSPATTGEEWPGGNGTFHRTFFVGPISSGTGRSTSGVANPPGPRNCGQGPACARGPSARTTSRATKRAIGGPPGLSARNILEHPSYRRRSGKQACPALPPQPTNRLGHVHGIGAAGGIVPLRVAGDGQCVVDRGREVLGRLRVGRGVRPVGI